MKKIYRSVTYRILPPEETFNNIKPILDKINIKEMKSIMGIDKLEIPVYYVRRVNNNIEYHHYGKGAVDIQAKVSACMEAIERASAKYDENKIKNEPENKIDINSLILPPYSDTDVKDWVEGYDIINSEPIDVPADAVFYPSKGKLFRWHTNGLASGNCLEEAILHGALEVIERDSWSLADLSKKIPTKINPKTDNEIINRLLEKFEKANVKVILKLLPNELNIPVISAIADDDPLLMCIGVGCHLDPEIAVIRALTELAQSRASQLHMKRDDAKRRAKIVKRLSYERAKKINRKWFEYEEEVELEDIENRAKYNLKKDINLLKEELFDHGFDRFIYVDLNKYGVDTVRVIIPKMEVYTIDRDRLSNMAIERMKKLYQ
ncbi:methanogenesis marker protein 1 [Methanocaldococcus villosus KIN24-T80]|uniref:Methanogenesis marker protein 1 n=1 Tax=Methanocaldococcus villosus KIN24-T80 TaxID=1069083 RepID=N6VTW7_9EURY|nr:YcaO-related McrA-glycine thioamidation protein [Methanocaldococcus villosus]ENN96611.1 methanogenesis marker protein 1 [Methanocaldococcus villosus KIN24-T80]